MKPTMLTGESFVNTERPTGEMHSSPSSWMK